MTEEALFPGVKLNIHAPLILAHCGPASVDLELERFGQTLLRAPGAPYGGNRHPGGSVTEGKVWR